MVVAASAVCVVHIVLVGVVYGSSGGRRGLGCVSGNLEITPTLLTGSGATTCSITRDDPTTTTTLPTLAVAGAVCTATAPAVPASGTETYTIRVTDIFGGDYASVVLTLGTP